MKLIANLASAAIVIAHVSKFCPAVGVVGVIVMAMAVANKIISKIDMKKEMSHA